MKDLPMAPCTSLPKQPHMPSRRILLRAAGGMALLLNGTRLAMAQGQGPAGPDPLAPWRAAPAAQHPDWRLRAAAWAVLAPNPHNRQPWLLDLGGADAVTLRCDLDRRLPATDPLDRQITIGLGAFAELFRMAAAQQAVALAIEAFPEGEPAPRLDARPVARLHRIPGTAEADPLFAHALARRSAKQAFDPGRTPSAAMLEAVRAAATPLAGFGTTTAPDRVAALRSLTMAAWMTELETPAAHAETVALMRLGRAEVAVQPDGISVWGPGIEPLIADGSITRQGFATPGHPAWTAMVDRYRAMLPATAAYVWSTSTTDTPRAAFEAGRQWLRLNLAATAQGLALQPVSQALQEYAAMDIHRAALAKLLNVPAPGRVQMLGRIGFLPEGARPPAPTPRWAAETRILPG
jgi:hypothetical protein